MKIEDMKSSPWNYNEMTEEEFLALFEQIRNDSQDGIIRFLIPIKVRPLSDGKFEIVNGHHKVKACQKLGKTEIPDEQIIIQTLDDTQALTEMIKERTRGSKVNAFKQSEAYKQLLDSGKTQIEIAQLSGLSQPRVSEILSRAYIIPEVKETLERMVSLGDIIPLYVYEEISLAKPDDQKYIMDNYQVIHDGGRPLSQEILKGIRLSRKPMTDLTPEETDFLSRRESSTQQFKGSKKRKGYLGHYRVPFYSEHDFVIKLKPEEYKEVLTYAQSKNKDLKWFKKVLKNTLLGICRGKTKVIRRKQTKLETKLDDNVKVVGIASNTDESIGLRTHEPTQQKKS